MVYKKFDPSTFPALPHTSYNPWTLILRFLYTSDILGWSEVYSQCWRIRKRTRASENSSTLASRSYSFPLTCPLVCFFMYEHPLYIFLFLLYLSFLLSGYKLFEDRRRECRADKSRWPETKEKDTLSFSLSHTLFLSFLFFCVTYLTLKRSLAEITRILPPSSTWNRWSQRPGRSRVDFIAFRRQERVVASLMLDKTVYDIIFLSSFLPLFLFLSLVFISFALCYRAILKIVLTLAGNSWPLSRCHYHIRNNVFRLAQWNFEKPESFPIFFLLQIKPVYYFFFFFHQMYQLEIFRWK